MFARLLTKATLKFWWLDKMFIQKRNYYTKLWHVKPISVNYIKDTFAVRLKYNAVSVLVMHPIKCCQKACSLAFMLFHHTRGPISLSHGKNRLDGLWQWLQIQSYYAAGIAWNPRCASNSLVLVWSKMTWCELRPKVVLLILQSLFTPNSICAWQWQHTQ
jgi:hypothetical protein